MAQKKTNAPKPVTKARIERALAGAEAVLEMLMEGYRRQKMTDPEIKQQTAYVQQATAVNLLRQQVEEFDKLFVAKGKPQGAPKRKKQQPQPRKPKTFLKKGARVLGVLTKEFETGFTFVKVTGTIADNGELTEVSGHTDIFLHVNNVVDLIERETLGKDSVIAFTVDLGKDDRLAAIEACAAEVQQVDERGPMADALDNVETK